jgi:transaldolase
LHARGARPQRPLWASTSAKDPAYRDTMYVEELVAAGTVNTMPEATLHATAAHGELRGDTIHGSYQESSAVFDALAELGISYDDVAGVLEEEGVQKFTTSWHELLATIETEMAAASARQPAAEPAAAPGEAT